MDSVLKKKIGQMIMTGIPGENVSEEFAFICREYSIGNFCISAENASSLENLCDLNSKLRKITHENTGIYPFISIDQEGGWVTRFYEGAAMLPGEMSYAASGADGDKMERLWAILGSSLRALGCNMNNAPVLDVNSDPENPIIGTRSFGDDPHRVAELGCGEVRGLARGGVIGVVKHFPGHGNVRGDTHLSVSKNISDEETFRKNDLLPFKRAFDLGAGALMTAHVTYETFGDEPATVSKEIMTDLLRGELKFEGVAITDSMNMNAMLDPYPDGEGAIRAIEAGCDILLYYPMNHKIFMSAINAIYAAVESGRLSAGRIEESYRRIIAVKERFAIAKADPDPTLARAYIHDEKLIGEILSDKLASVTCLKGAQTLSCLADERILCVSPVCDALRGVEESRRKILSFADEFAKSFEDSRACVSSTLGMTDNVRDAINGEYSMAVVGVFDARGAQGQLEIIKAIREKGKKVIAVLLRSPYDFEFVRECDAVICCYEYTPLAVEATVSAMKNNEYNGKLPINI